MEVSGQLHASAALPPRKEFTMIIKMMMMMMMMISLSNVIL
jgi:hypothetical protein